MTLALVAIGLSAIALLAIGGVRVIDATGLTVLPGLMDMRVHARAWMWPLLLRFGITTVRDVGSDPEFILNERQRERRGELLAPRILRRRETSGW